MMLKRLMFSWVLLADVSGAQTEETLSEVDRQLLLEKLAEIQDTSKDSVKTRYSSAFSAFQTGASSDNAAHDLYVKCVEKIRFQDEAKKSGEFRAWRRRHKEREDSPAFRRALRHQLVWLVMSMEMSRKPEFREKAGPRALGALEDVLRDHDKLKGAQKVLNASVLTSIFARAYKIDNMKIKDWPNSPLDIAGIYNQLVFPPLRKLETVGKLRAAWKNRVSYEGRLIEKWGQEGSVKGRRPELEKWYYNERLDLLWSMEKDIFTVGDQRAAARNMLKFLEKNIHHPKAPSWISEFKSTIKGLEEDKAESRETPSEEGNENPPKE